MKRLFIAIKIEPNKAFLDVYNDLISKLSYEKLRFVEPDKLHLWFGIDHNEFLTHLHTRIELDLTKVGFYPDRQNYVPHLTLSRIKQLKDGKLFQRIINNFREIEIMKQEVSSFSLIESILLKEGPIYQILSTYTLQKQTPPVDKTAV
jgi:2'-5' RNA ligase